MKTYDDLTTEIYRALESSDGDYDIDAIADELREKVGFDEKHGYGSIADIDDDEFWAVAMAHAKED